MYSATEDVIDLQRKPFSVALAQSIHSSSVENGTALNSFPLHLSVEVSMRIVGYLGRNSDSDLVQRASMRELEFRGFVPTTGGSCIRCGKTPDGTGRLYAVVDPKRDELLEYGIYCFPEYLITAVENAAKRELKPERKQLLEENLRRFMAAKSNRRRVKLYRVVDGIPRSGTDEEQPREYVSDVLLELFPQVRNNARVRPPLKETARFLYDYLRSVGEECCTEYTMDEVLAVEGAIEQLWDNYRYLFSKLEAFNGPSAGGAGRLVDGFSFVVPAGWLEEVREG